MKDRKQIEKLYKLYNFQEIETNNDYSIFLQDFGYFKNLEAIYDDESKVNKEAINKEYLKSGYSTPKYYKYTDLNSLHLNLFKGFFRFDQYKKGLQRSYARFKEEKKKTLLGNEYRYIPCSYQINYEENRGNLSLIECLLQDIKTSSGFFILEAAAGFGKTCATFELMNSITELADADFVPLFIELSRNRSAPIFHYVLLDEIDRNFPTLNSDLVLEEIKQGNIPLIIDGFDELLSTDNLEKENSERSKTMIQTLFELVGDDSKAKIILTSRKTSLITNGVLEKIIENNHQIKRYTILDPDIKNWLSPELRSIFKSKKFDIEKLANPILLTMLKNMDDGESFVATDFDFKMLIEKYLNNLLTREIDRQELLLSPEEQIELFTCFTKFFTDFNISSEEADMVNLYFKEILSTNYQLEKQVIKLPPVTEILKKYNSYKTKPTEEQFIGKLSRHALLDSSKTDNNQIGFINEFLFAVFIGKVLEKFPDSLLEEKHIDILATAYTIMPETDKKRLFSVLQKSLEYQKNEFIIQIDNLLLKFLSKSYNNLQLESMIFTNFDFSKENTINYSFFQSCRFDKCIFSNKITNSQFFNCHFYDCVYKDGNKLVNPELKNIFVDCKGNLPNTYTIPKEEKSDDEIYEKRVLEQYWAKGRPNAELRRYPKTLYRGFDVSEYKAVENAIERLKRKHYLEFTGLCYELKTEKISEIKKVLGR